MYTVQIADAQISVSHVATDPEFNNKGLYEVLIRQDVGINGFYTLYKSADMSVPYGQDPLLSAICWLEYAASGEAQSMVFNDAADTWAILHADDIDAMLVRDQSSGEAIALTKISETTDD